MKRNFFFNNYYSQEYYLNEIRDEKFSYCTNIEEIIKKCEFNIHLIANIIFVLVQYLELLTEFTYEDSFSSAFENSIHLQYFKTFGLKHFQTYHIQGILFNPEQV